MKLLIVDDFLFGHKKLNNKIINVLKEKYDLIIMNYNNYYDNYYNDEKIQIIEMPKRMPGFRRQPLKYISIIYNYIYLCYVIKKLKIKFDVMLFLHINNLGISYINNVFKKNRIIVFDHDTVDAIKNKYELRRFNKYKNSVSHIVFDDFIKEGMIEKYGVNKELIYVLVHPLKDINIIINKHSNSNKQKLIISTGWESDELLIQDIFLNLKDSSLLQQNNIKLVIRSSKISYADEHLEIFTGVLSDQEYLNLYKKADAVLLPYEKSYGMRYSGSALDTLENGKILIGRDIPLMKSFRSKYPNNCFVFDDFKDMIEIINNIKFNCHEEEHTKFLKNHSNEKFIESLLSIIEEEKT